MIFEIISVIREKKIPIDKKLIKNTLNTINLFNIIVSGILNTTKTILITTLIIKINIIPSSEFLRSALLRDIWVLIDIAINKKIQKLIDDKLLIVKVDFKNNINWLSKRVKKSIKLKLLPKYK